MSAYPQPPGGRVLEGDAARLAGAPDPAFIAQLANAFFHASPWQSPPSLGGTAPSIPSPEAAISGVPPAFAAPPTVGHQTTEPRVPQIGPLAAAPVPPPVQAVQPPSDGFDFSQVLNLLGNELSLLPEGSSTVPAQPQAPVTLQTVDSDFLGVQLRPDQLPDLKPVLGVRPFDAHAVKRDFPILQEEVHGRPLVWLDNAATTQKPKAVIDRLKHFYEHENSNIHRAAHTLAARSTDAYEAARESVRRFLNAGSVEEIVFVRGATEGINLVAQSWGRRNVKAGDEIVVTWLEHHANIVPWQQLASETGAKLRVAPVDDSGQIILEEYERLINPRTRIVSLTQVSNALGTVTPAAQMAEIAHRHGAVVLIDGAQSVSHMPTDVQALGADFFVFSGHKVFGPTGIGALYGRKELLNSMPPWQGGGNMIADVTFEKTIYQAAPARFEAGTGNIADAVGLGTALDYLSSFGLANIQRYEHDLLAYATQGLLTVPGLRLVGTAKEKAGVLSFVLDGHKTEEVGKALDAEGIAVRSGHHCAQPILRRFGLESTVRPSLALYNTCEDIDALVSALLRLQGTQPKSIF